MSTYSKASIGAGAFAGYVLLYGGDRRRYGTYNQESGNDKGECTMNSETAIERACETRAGVGASCYDCVACETESCINSITGYDCEEFLGEVYIDCTEEGEGIGAGGIVFLVMILLCFIGCCCYCVYKSQRNDSANGASAEQLEDAKNRREGMTPCNGVGLTNLDFRGTYSENGETKTTSYQMNFSPDGSMSGSSLDDDGQAGIFGKVNWIAGSPGGQIAWCETRPGVNIEASGFIQSSPSGQVTVSATYLSNSLAAQGSVNVQSVGGLQNQAAWGSSTYGSGLQNHSAYGGAYGTPVVTGMVVGAPTGVTLPGNVDQSSGGGKENFLNK